jgi:hypothetical protein
MVNWPGVALTGEKEKATCDGALATSLPITAENVVEVAACARARWKIENESFNVPKNNGCNLAHNFAPRQQIPGQNLRHHEPAGLRLPHRLRLPGNPLATSPRGGRRARFFQDLHIVTAYVLFPSWHSLIDTIASGKAPPI